MIIVKLIGGLGNQLFQYAVGRHLAHMNHTELKLDITGFEEYKLHSYSLNHLNIKENFATKEEVRSFRKYQRRNGRVWFAYNRLVADDTKYIIEKQFNFDQRILDLKPPVYLDGYWQTERYFKDIESIIRAEFTIKEPLSGENMEVADLIQKTNAISLHVRRADYISNAVANASHGTCDVDYYKKTTSIIMEKVSNPHFFIFSDDMVWAKQNIILDDPTTYVDHNDASTNYEDLRLMSLCKHNIIANSSFSWWGAWLNTNPQKIIIAPQQWFKTPKMDTRDITPSTWTKI